jgi:hypothetical protein
MINYNTRKTTMATKTETNRFIGAVGFRATTLTENGAVTNVTTGSLIVDQFGKAGNFRGRALAEVFDDQAKIWNENAEAALRFPFYLRMITRKVKVNKDNETDKVQNGQGARDESFKRLLWIAVNHPQVFYNNIWALPLVGSWKDIWQMMFLDNQEGTNAISHEAMFELISQGLMSDTHVDLIKKFMPRIKSEKKCKTPWTKVTNELAKEFAKFSNISYKEYNKLKSSGNGHDFQKLICSRKYDALNWNHIPGRALNLLVTSKFLSNHNLKDSYTQWIMSKPVAKYTGYVFELAKKARQYGLSAYSRGHFNLPVEVKHTLDAQFMGLVDKARANGKITENVWCALDTSGSMQTAVKGLKDICCEDIASSLAIFFGELNTGAFHNKIIMFDDTSYPYDMKGDSFCERLGNLPSVPAGSTNFQSIVEEIVKIRRAHPEIPLEDYPKTILVVSDMQFNPVRYSWRSNGRTEPTNYEYSKRTLKEVFPAEFVDSMKFIWWDCASRYGNTDYEGGANEEGCYFFSGFDGSIISMLLNEDAVKDEKTGEVRRPTAEELVMAALSQEVLNYIKL